MTVYKIIKKFPNDYVFARIEYTKKGKRKYIPEWIFHSYTDYLEGSKSLNLSKKNTILIPPFSENEEDNDMIPPQATAEYFRTYYA